MIVENSIRHVIADWDNRFPLDRWWRCKYNVPYLSKEHRESTFFGQYFEYHEDRMYDEYFRKRQEGAKKYVPMSGNWWQMKETSNEEIDDWLNTPI